MLTHKVLYSRKNNENYTTSFYPVGPYVEGAVDLNAKGTFCASPDWDMLVPGDLYEVRDVTLPDWLSVEEWVAHITDWKWAWGFGVERETWPENWQRAIACRFHGRSAELLSVVKLLKTKNFKSDFRKSLRDQLVKWLDTPSDKREHSSPFSPKQWDALIDRYTLQEAKRLDEALYRNR